MMTHLRQRTAVCLTAGWLVVGSSPGALAHPTSAEEYNNMGSCAALGNSVAEGVWQWCAKNEEKNMNGCKASFRSWVREVERTCDQRRRELGCSPSDYDAVQWHMHGWKRPGQKLSLHRAVRYCEEDTQGQAAGSGAGGAPPELDREARRRVQSALAAQGFDPGQPDGVFGPRTRGAIQAWQRANGHAATGELTAEQAERLLAVETTPTPTAPATPGDRFGSIAFSQLDGGGYAFGIVWNTEGHEAAKRMALEECRRQDGGSGCREVAWFSNQCGALAIGDDNGYGTGAGKTNAAAEKDALAKCREEGNRNCRVEVSRCVDRDYRRNDPVARRPSGSICAELPGQYLGENHAECWEEFENQRGCYRWSHHFHSDRTVRWSGRCDGGLAAGRGTLSVSAGSEHVSWDGTGTMSGGKLSGRWTEEWADGTRSDAEYRDGKVNGYGTVTWADGDRYEGNWRDGKRHGRGTFTWADGHRYEGAWRAGKPHGQGTLAWSNGNRDEGEWRGGCFGERDGRWSTIFTSAAECGFE